MGAKKRKEKLFELYSNNFKMVTKYSDSHVRIEEPIYVCPLCKRYFNSESLDSAEKNHLTLEHVPPKAVGGKDFVLTCKECNNVHGSKLDSHLDKKIKHERFMNMNKGEIISTSFVVNEEMKAGGYIKIGEDKDLNFVFQEERTNPKYHKDLKEVALGNHESGKIEFTIKGYSKKKSNLSILRSAYLIAFQKLGYGFLLSKNSNIPRKIIMDGHKNDEYFYAMFVGGIPDEMLGVNIIMEPKELNGYCVVVKIMNENYGVVLPGSNKEGESIYQVYDELVSKDRNMKIALYPIPGLDYINNEKYALSPHFNWTKQK